MKRTIQDAKEWLACFDFVPGQSYNVRTVQSSSYMCVDFVEAEFEANEVRTYWRFDGGSLVVPVPWETSLVEVKDMFSDADEHLFSVVASSPVLREVSVCDDVEIQVKPEVEVEAHVEVGM